MGPTECKWCGCGDTIFDYESVKHFMCGSGYWPGNNNWYRGTHCIQQNARIAGLKDRIQRAVAVLEGAERYDCEALDGSTCRERHDGGGEVDADIVDQVIEILKGDDINSPESSNSSPITTDDLAASDYYEAVRQRVPWIVNVEYIEGLVEGYRQCGVMAWKAVEHIQRIYGGDYGQAE